MQELEDQVRDVMFFLEAWTKIEDGEGQMAEVAGGDIAIRPPRRRRSRLGGRRKGGVRLTIHPHVPRSRCQPHMYHYLYVPCNLYRNALMYQSRHYSVPIV